MKSFFNWELVYQYFPKILSALPVTLMIVTIATLVGLVLGSLIAFVRVEKIPILSQISAVFVSFIRGTPILVQLYVVYYGIPTLLEGVNIDVSSWNKIFFIYITYGLNTAAFQSETIRAAILSVPATQKEAAIACGLTRFQMYRSVILPQMVRVALPSFGTTTVALLQDTSLAFTIGVIDVVGKAKAIGAVTFHTLEGYVGAAIIFIVLSFVLERIFAWLEEQMKFEQVSTKKMRLPSLLFFQKKEKVKTTSL
ncbi:amino acid ABC transporter permease [Enterococcus camelliae]|uniref:Amino acid ABC transporter permease n=1 Tax=Enterococcus camelliae TaxID=453959 RepID=A0ABW5THH4_9ENTE